VCVCATWGRGQTSLFEMLCCHWLWPKPVAIYGCLCWLRDIRGFSYIQTHSDIHLYNCTHVQVVLWPDQAFHGQMARPDMSYTQTHLQRQTLVGLLWVYEFAGVRMGVWHTRTHTQTSARTRLHPNAHTNQPKKNKHPNRVACERKGQRFKVTLTRPTCSSLWL